MLQSILKVIRGIVKIRGNSDNTLIGNDGNRLMASSQLVGADGSTKADVTLLAGKQRLAVDAQTTVSVEELLGLDNIADSWFTITVAGAIGDTVRVQIPDDSVDVTSTLTATEAGNTDKLAELLVSDLNSDSTFSALYKAKQVSDDNAVVHISSRFIAERGERLDVNDFQVTTTGTTAVVKEDDKLQRRAKTTSLSRDPDDPRIGILGISGTVNVLPGAIGSGTFEFFVDGGASSDLRVNGSGTPVEFLVGAISDEDIFVTQIRLFGGGNGIKFGNFLSQNSTLSNGIAIEIRSDNEVFSFPALTSTEDLKNLLASTAEDFRIDVQAGGDQALATFRPSVPFPIRAVGTFGTGNDDHVKITIRDNLSSGLAQLQAVIIGFRRPA